MYVINYLTIASFINFEYTIDEQPRLDVSDLMDDSLVVRAFKYDDGATDYFFAVKDAVEMSLGEVIGNWQDIVKVEYRAKDGATVTEMTDMGEYEVVITSLGYYVLSDGLSDIDSAVILRLTVCKIDWLVEGSGMRLALYGYSDDKGFTDIGLKVRVNIVELFK